MTAAVNNAARPRFDVALLVSGSAAFSISTMYSSMKPVLIASFIEQAGYSPSLAGLAAAMPFVGGVFASILMPWLLRRLSVGTAITGFGAGLVVMELANAVWFAVPALLLSGQFVAGVCGGMLIGLLSQLIAVSARSEQSFGVVDMVGVLMMSLMIAAVGAAIQWGGLRGAFLTAAGLCTIFGGTMHLSRGALPCVSEPGMAVNRGPIAVSWRAVVVIVMGVAFVTFSGLGFAFMFSAARGLGFSYRDAGSAIGAILFVTAAGCLFGGWCAAQFGPKIPLLCAFALCAVGWHVALHAQSQIVFLLALAPAIFALNSSFPVLLALAGSFDSDGRLAGIAAPLIVSGFAWAAILAGIVVDHWGIGALSIVTAAGMIVCAALLLAGTSEPASLDRAEPI